MFSPGRTVAERSNSAGGKAVLAVPDELVIAPDSGSAVRTFQPDKAVLPPGGQGETALIFPDGVVLLRDLTGVQRLVAVPGVLGLHIVGVPYGRPGRCRLLHLDKARNGQLSTQRRADRVSA